MKPTEIIVIPPTPVDQAEYGSGYACGLADAEYGDFPQTEGYEEEFDRDWLAGYEDGYYSNRA